MGSLAIGGRTDHSKDFPSTSTALFYQFTVAIMKELELLGFVSEIKECVIKGVLFHQDFAQDSKCAKSISP